MFLPGFLTKQQSNQTSKMATSVADMAKVDQKQQTPTKSSSGTSSNVSQQQQSPRNTATSVVTSGTCISVGPVEVSKLLQDGEKFVKWDEVSHYCINENFTFIRMHTW